MRTLLALVVIGIGMALAQEEIPTDISAWFRDTAALAAVVASIVALIRRHVWRSLDGLAVVAVSLALGVGLAYLGYRMGYVGSEWLTFGLAAGLGASGGTAWLRSIVGGGSAPAGDTHTDAGRSRLR